MAKKRELDHRQMGLFIPGSTWTRPTSLPHIPDGATVAIDTETRDEGLNAEEGPGWALNRGHLCGVSYAWANGADYLPVQHPDSDCFTLEEVTAWLIDLEHRCTLVFQNATYDIGWLHLRPTKRIYDTHAAAVLIDENRLDYSLNAISVGLGLPGKDETLLREVAAAMGVHPKKELWRLPARYVAPYAIQDAVATLNAHERQSPIIMGQNLTQAYELECRLIPHIRDMRARGMRIDVDHAEQLRGKYLALRDETLKQAKEYITTDHHRLPTVNDMRSPKWLEWQFDQAGILYPRKESTNNPSFEKEWLERQNHPLPKFVVRVRSLDDAAEKFLGNYILGFLHMGRLHAEINQLRDAGEGTSKGTRSYRFSYGNPPLQQMPRPEERNDPDIGQEIRGCFLAEEGEVFGAPDYSQQEYRWIVLLSEELKLAGAAEAAQMYRDDDSTDFHNYVRDVTGLPRKRAKDCNFAKAFGAGIPKFAEMTGMALDEAKGIMDQYDEKLPFVKQFGERCKSVADTRGYVRLLDNYRARFDTWECSWLDPMDWGRGRALGQKMDACSYEEARARADDKEHVWYGKRLRRAKTHKSGNRVIQGSAAVQTKKALLAQAEAGMLPLIQMHDELGHSVPNARYARDIVEIMRTVVIKRVPFKVDAEFGATWGTCKKSYEEAVSSRK